MRTIFSTRSIVVPDGGDYIDLIFECHFDASVRQFRQTPWLSLNRSDNQKLGLSASLTIFIDVDIVNYDSDRQLQVP